MTKHMRYTIKIQKAIKFAAKTHQVYQDQKRKGKVIPYITHPMTVGLILSLVGASEDAIIAGILHDTIEDSADHKKVSNEMIVERFGENVAMLVDSVTENKELSHGERKEEALNNIVTFSNDSVLVKSADILSNTSEIADDYVREGEAVFERFSGSKEKTLSHYLRVIEALILRWPENPLADDLRNVSMLLNEIKDFQMNDESLSVSLMHAESIEEAI